MYHVDPKNSEEFTIHLTVSTVPRVNIVVRLVIWVTYLVTVMVNLVVVYPLEICLFGVIQKVSWEELSLSINVKMTLDVHIVNVPKKMDVLVESYHMVSLVICPGDLRLPNLTINYYSYGLEKNLLIIILLI